MAKTEGLTIDKLREQSAEELRARLDESKQNLFKMRVRTVTKEQHNPMDIRRAKKDVARILTVMGEKKKKKG